MREKEELLTLVKVKDLKEREDNIGALKKALKLKAEELSAQHVCVGMVSMGNSGA